MSEPPIPEEPTIVTGWVDAVAAAEAGAIAYTDEQVPIVAGRMVPRNMDRAPLVEDGADLLDGTGWNQYDPVTGDLVQMWRWDGTAWQALDMSAEMIPVLDIGSATVGDLTGGRINVTEGPIVAGAPGGARVEITGDGLHAYDATGAETATIQGEGGVFVGGSFRTSDNLPGQVTLSDDAYVTHFDGGGTFPGVKVVPIDTTDMQLPAAIGPSTNGLTIFGGSNTAGGSSIVQANPDASFMRTFHEGGATAGTIQTSPTASFMRTYREDGVTAGAEIMASPDASLMRTYREDGTTGGTIQTSPTASLMRTYREDGTTGGQIQTSPTASLMRTYSGNSSESGWVRVQPQDAELAYVAPDNTYFSRIKADASEASLYTRAGGTTRYLSVDADGVWVKTNRSGSWESWNLEETANDSGWQNFAMNSTIRQFGNPAYRIKGGIVWFRGVLQLLSTQNWSAGWTTLGVVPTAAWPSVLVRRAITSDAEANDALVMLLEVGTDGTFRMRLPRTLNGLAQVHMTAMNYPLG